MLKVDHKALNSLFQNPEISFLFPTSLPSIFVAKEKGLEIRPSEAIWASENKSIVCVSFTPEIFWGLVHTSLEEGRIHGPSHFWLSQPAGCWDYLHGFQSVNAWKHLLRKGSLARGRHLSNSEQHFTLHFQIMPLLENDLLQEEFIKLNTCHYAMQNSWSNQMSGIYIFKRWEL